LEDEDEATEIDLPPSERPDMWDDIDPVKQDDGPLPMVVIPYDRNVEAAMDLFRAMFRLNERSERALLLTNEVIGYNAANYTAWYFRRACLTHLKKNLLEELDYVRDWTKRSPKNYQVWYHRRWVVESLNDDCDEKSLMDEELDEDSKNYNAWGHRQWLVRYFDSWEGELDYVTDLIQFDCQNNSAWNYRRFTVFRPGINVDDETFRKEVEYALHWVSKVPSNESAWNYLLKLLCLRGEDRPPASSQETAPSSLDPAITSMVYTAVDRLLDADCDLKMALEAKYKILSAVGQSDEAIKVLKKLEVADPVRRRFWQYKSRVLQRSASSRCM